MTWLKAIWNLCKDIFKDTFVFTYSDWQDHCALRREFKKDEVFDKMQLNVSIALFVIGFNALVGLMHNLLLGNYCSAAIAALALWVSFIWYVNIKKQLGQLINYAVKTYHIKPKETQQENQDETS